MNDYGDWFPAAFSNWGANSGGWLDVFYIYAHPGSEKVNCIVYGDVLQTTTPLPPTTAPRLYRFRASRAWSITG
ncbi:MAG: hypothetical protein L6W00_14115 [Lentisphaeria bacterium]|nr:MAG: hypothetical protein L6W00_14115 [Lentisphaeria bacterium]